MAQADVLPAVVTSTSTAQIVFPAAVDARSQVLPAGVSVEGAQTVTPSYPGSGSGL
jgi:hypothetical protein